MEDLLEELLNVLSEPPNRQTVNSEASPTKRIAVSNGTSMQEGERNSSSASLEARQQADRTTKNPTLAEDAPKLMTIASLSNRTIERLQHANQPSSMARETSKRSMLFDAGIAVPDLTGHCAFHLTDEQPPNEQPLDEQPPNEQPTGMAQDSQENADSAAAVEASVENEDEVSKEADQREADACGNSVEDNVEGDSVEEDNVESYRFLVNSEVVAESRLDEIESKLASHKKREHEFAEFETLETDEFGSAESDLDESETDEFETDEFDSAESELDESELDESVISAFDIGDFESDPHATRADKAIAEGEAAGDHADLGDRDSNEFDPDDLDLNDLDLYSQDFESERTQAAENDFYMESDAGLADDSSLVEVADISTHEIAEKERKKNFLARWFQRWIQPDDASESGSANEPPEPKLFESDHIQLAQPDRATQMTQVDDLELELRSFLESATERGAAQALIADDASPVDRQASETAAESPEVLDFSEADFSEADFGEVDDEAIAGSAIDANAEESVTVKEADQALADRDPADRDLIEATVPMHDEMVALSVAELETTTDTLFESDLTLESGDSLDEETLLEPLGEKSWLSATDNANEALYASAAAGDLSGVWAALEANAGVNTLGSSQRTALSIAVEAGHLPVVKMLLEMCANPNQADITNGSPVRYPLMVAASEVAAPVQGELIRLLLASGAKVNQANVMGQTALMGAAEKGHLEAMRLLLDANANADAQDLLGQTATTRAREGEQAEAIALLQQNSLEREQAIALLKAVTRGDLAEVQQWLAAGMSANTRVARMSALTQAAAKGEVAIARLLIKSGADINYRFYPTDPTPLFHAAYRGHLEMILLLLEAGASTQPTPNYPIGALEYAEIGQRKAENADTFQPVVALLSTLATRSQLSPGKQTPTEQSSNELPPGELPPSEPPSDSQEPNSQEPDSQGPDSQEPDSQDPDSQKPDR